MFRYEKEMIPVLKKFFIERLKQNLYVEELNTGIGIADIVFSNKIYKRDYYFDNFELLFHTLTLLNRRNKKISEFDFTTRFSKKQISDIIEKYISMELIKEDNSKYYVKNKLAPTVSEFCAVEAKLKDWKNGFYQALRYKNFAQKSYLALAEDFIHRVDKKLFIENNIGLISVSLENTRIIINPTKESPNDKVAFYYIGDKFTKNIFLNTRQSEYYPQQWL